jgi:hypothetical protein
MSSKRHSLRRLALFDHRVKNGPAEGIGNKSSIYP